MSEIEAAEVVATGAGLPVFLTTDELAAITRRSPATVRYWRHAGTGPKGSRVGKRVLYRREDVAAWLKVSTGAVA